MQIVHETTAAGYVNYIRDTISNGAGSTVDVTGTSQRDIQPDFNAETGLADQPSSLVDRIADKLMAGAMPAALKAEIEGAIEKIAIPAVTATNAAQVAAARRTRVNAAIFLAMVSPEFQVQK
jgi:hypothetical protein